MNREAGKMVATPQSLNPAKHSSTRPSRSRLPAITLALACTPLVVASALLVASPAVAQISQSGPTTSQATSSSSSTAALPPAVVNRKIGLAAPVTYDNKYEVYGGINYMNFKAGQNLPDRMDLGGAEIMATRWFTPHLGAAADYRFEAGTTPVLPSPVTFNPSRLLVQMNIGMLGAQYRGPKNKYAAVDYHVLAGVDAGNFHTPPGFNVGLYDNTIKPIAAIGGSLDYNRSKRIGIRLQPDLILTHFGNSTSEFFSISAGVLYRIGKR